MSGQVLAVWIDGRRVGTLERIEGGFSFRYDSEWLSATNRYPLSPHLPLQPGPFQDGAEDRRVFWFFDNLRLARFRGERPGALTLLPKGQPFPTGSYRPLSTDELRQLITGAQHELRLHRTAEGAFLLPEQASSSVLIKTGNRFPFCPANEHFCLALAQRVGIAAARSELLHLPEPLLVVERFDRRVDEAGAVSRLHQIDLCQLLNQWAGRKYESDGGITFQEAFRALDLTRQPAVSRNQLLRWLLFNYIVGNSDAHAKNIAFLLSERGLALAPAYDLLCVAVYGDDFDYMAMTIAAEVRYGWVEAEHWNRLGRSIGIAAAFLRRLRQELGTTIPAAARALLEEEPSFTDAERRFLERVVEVIDRHAGYALE